MTTVEEANHEICALQVPLHEDVVNVWREYFQSRAATCSHGYLSAAGLNVFTGISAGIAVDSGMPVEVWLTACREIFDAVQARAPKFH